MSDSCLASSQTMDIIQARTLESSQVAQCSMALPCQGIHNAPTLADDLVTKSMISRVISIGPSGLVLLKKTVSH